MLEGFFQIAVTLLILVAITSFFGRYMARVYLGEKTLLDPVMGSVERSIYALGDMRANRDMTGWQYARAVLLSNLAMGVLVYFILMHQARLPLNPTGLGALNWHIAVHTTISFVTNTDQQHYTGEETLSYGSQMLALGYLMFVSAATGLAVAIAFIRGLTGRPLGNFYVTLTLSITRILLPISIVSGVILIILGVPETLAGPQTVTTLQGTTQAIARGPVAHFEIIKMLGENGGGFFGVNSAHPFENPNPASNLLENLALISIPAALIITYGIFAGNEKQGWMLFWMVFIIFAVLVGITAVSEYEGNPLVNKVLGGQWPNLEGKEVRFGWAATALWAVATTGTMCGAVNGMHDSLMPIGGFSTLFNMLVQVIWGGQGTGTAYLFIYLILTVFLTGLMVGRTPEIFGRKIEKREIALASVALIVHPIAILFTSGITLAFADTLSGISNPSFHGLTQVVYEYTSAASNNGSGFEGLKDNTLWWNLTTCFSILVGRYVPIIAILLLADSISHKQSVPETEGTLRTDTRIFTSVTAMVILILGALTFFIVLALGPIAEAFQIARGG